MESQYVRKDVWEVNICGFEDFMKNQVWSGTTNTHFLAHASQHRKPFTNLQEAQAYVAAEIPNERSRVTYLLDLITCIYPSILAALSAIGQGGSGKRVQSQDAVAFSAPVCPVLRNANKKKRALPNVHIASTIGLSGNVKSGKGKTGVDLRYYLFKEFKNVPEDQQEKLKKSRSNNKRKVSGRWKDRGNGGNNSNKRMTCAISSIMSKHNETFKAISESQVVFPAALPSLSIPVGQNAQVGSTTDVVSVAMDPRIKFNEDQEKLMNAAQVAAVKVQGILKKKSRAGS